MTTTIYIQNLKCGGCANTVTKNLSQLDGIENVSVSVDESAVTFDYNHENLVAEVKELLKKIGYPEAGDENSLGTKAKSFVSCAVGKMS
ncbi:heavy-metal-associated domain-containing protein [Flavobacterium sp. NRK F10]|uniref:heavy-metal-associated domain-containing protein n=1 Tax=Flavobacterium sp. NRK F10 TaxID=2954931 RepID=UPI0020910DA1|nr:heavy metal-associated domain-containing protein [Flavobacterium sp. NRK F10]MCO6176454.1 heavy-metal-associated domain-containing protein [Flavobacterium sp. NRK F10]